MRNEDDTHREYMTAKEAAAYLRIGLSTMRRLMMKGRIPVFRPLPDAPRLRKSDLDQFMVSTASKEALR